MSMASCVIPVSPSPEIYKSSTYLLIHKHHNNSRYCCMSKKCRLDQMWMSLLIMQFLDALNYTVKGLDQSLGQVLIYCVGA